MTKRIDPISGFFSTLDAVVKGNPYRDDVLTDEVPGFTIDICRAFDTRMWETAIAPTGKDWVIVEQYEDRDKAIIGHKRWKESLITNPTQELQDINLWNQ